MDMSRQVKTTCNMFKRPSIDIYLSDIIKHWHLSVAVRMQMRVDVHAGHEGQVLGVLGVAAVVWVVAGVVVVVDDVLALLVAVVVLLLLLVVVVVLLRVDLDAGLAAVLVQQPLHRDKSVPEQTCKRCLTMFTTSDFFRQSE